MSQPPPSLLASPRAAARLSMPDFFLSAPSPFSRSQKKPCATTIRASAARSFLSAAAASSLRNAVKDGSSIGLGKTIATGLYGPGGGAGGRGCADAVPAVSTAPRTAMSQRLRMESLRRAELSDEISMAASQRIGLAQAAGKERRGGSAGSVPGSARSFRHAQDRQSAHADKQQAKHQRDGEQAVLMADHVADHIGAGDAGGDDGGGDDGAQRQRNRRHELGD